MRRKQKQGDRRLFTRYVREKMKKNVASKKEDIPEIQKKEKRYTLSRKFKQSREM